MATKPWRIASCRDGTYAGLVAPASLRFASADEALKVAGRYASAFADQAFRAVRLDDKGGIVETLD